MSTNSRWIAEQAFDDLKHYTADAFHPRPSDASHCFIVSDSTKPIEVPQGSVRDGFGHNIAIFTKGQHRFIQLGSVSTIRLDMGRARVEGRLHRLHERTPISRALTKWSIVKSLERKGIFPVHSSAVLDHSAKAHLFVGPSGSGKTSTLILFLLNNHIMVADDLVFYREGTLYPFTMRSTLEADTIRRLKKLPTVRPVSHKLALKPGLVDLTASFERRTEKFEPTDLAVFYLNVWNSSRSKMIRVAKKKMLGMLISAYFRELDNSYWYGWERSKVAAQAMKAYASLLQEAECFEVFAGWDLRKLSELIVIQD